ncbi:MAG: phosphate-starvation-inducible PsiE family protein, partial [Deltaproteobacteria bacterium]|nr:phosphate-starvation-inducible PsiE family protein [Deltaproteobacteria bacterium]
LETIKAYLTDHIVHVEIVLEVALIAIARKVIILEPKELSALTLLGIAALIVTLASAFYLEKHARRSDRVGQEPKAPSS